MSHITRNIRYISRCMSMTRPTSSGRILQQNVTLPLVASSTNGLQKRSLASAPDYEMIKVSTAGEGNKIGVITLNRPKALNALCNQLMMELIDAMSKMDSDNSINVVIMTGSERAFAAGADIKEMQGKAFSEVFDGSFLNDWEKVARTRKPVIAAVNGYALGGGCEVALMADIIIAGEKAKFGQPEVTIGTIPGGGGTQRLTKAIGKSRSMQMNLTGEPINAKQALEWGIVSSVHEPEKLMDAAITIGNQIARHSPLITKIVKESVSNAYEMSLQDGLRTEKRLFHTTFATEDRKEGMTAFVEKRKPNFTGK